MSQPPLDAACTTLSQSPPPHAQREDTFRPPLSSSFSRHPRLPLSYGGPSAYIVPHVAEWSSREYSFPQSDGSAVQALHALATQRQQSLASLLEAATTSASSRSSSSSSTYSSCPSSSSHAPATTSPVYTSAPRPEGPPIYQSPLKRSRIPPATAAATSSATSSPLTHLPSTSPSSPLTSTASRPFPPSNTSPSQQDRSGDHHDIFASPSLSPAPSSPHPEDSPSSSPSPPPSPSKSATTQHQKDDTRPYVCHLCDFAFVRSHDLTRHRRGHSNDKPYQCPTCPKRFSRKDALKRHARRSRCGLPKLPKGKTGSVADRAAAGNGGSGSSRVGRGSAASGLVSGGGTTTAITTAGVQVSTKTGEFWESNGEFEDESFGYGPLSHSGGSKQVPPATQSVTAAPQSTNMTYRLPLVPQHSQPPPPPPPQSVIISEVWQPYSTDPYLTASATSPSASAPTSTPIPIPASYLSLTHPQHQHQHQHHPHLTQHQHQQQLQQLQQLQRTHVRHGVPLHQHQHFDPTHPGPGPGLDHQLGWSYIPQQIPTRHSNDINVNGFVAPA